MSANKYCNLYGENKIRDDYTKINDGFALVQKDVAEALDYINSIKVWNGIASDLDVNGIPTTVSYKRRDGTLFLKITLANKSIDVIYQSCTATYYGRDGVTITSESTYSIPGI